MGAAHSAVGPTLPFTGLELGRFVLVGVGLIGLGFLLRRDAARRDEQPGS